MSKVQPFHAYSVKIAQWLQPEGIQQESLTPKIWVKQPNCAKIYLLDEYIFGMAVFLSRIYQHQNLQDIRLQWQT